MKLRTLTAVAVATLAVVGLAGCRSNVGTAATVNGHRISESRVSSYITPDAKPARAQAQNGQSFEVAPRAVVAQTLIEIRLLEAVLAAAPGGAPSQGRVAQARAAVLAGKSAKQFTAAHGLTGFTDSFADVFVHDQALGALLTSYQQQGVDVRRLLAQTRLHVSVSPRYGKWDPQSLSLLGGNAGSNLPGYLTLQPAAQ